MHANNFDLFSPTNGTLYTVTDLINKALVRSNVGWYLEFQRITFSEDSLHKLQYDKGFDPYTYHDFDSWVTFHIAVGESKFTESLYGIISGFLPIHFSYRNGMTIGHSIKIGGMKPTCTVGITFEGFLNNDMGKPYESVIALKYDEISHEINKGILAILKEFIFRESVDGRSIHFITKEYDLLDHEPDEAFKPNLDNAKVWLEKEAADELDVEMEGDDLAIFTDNGKVTGLYCSSGKVSDLNMSISELESLVIRHDLTCEADD